MDGFDYSQYSMAREDRPNNKRRVEESDTNGSQPKQARGSGGRTMQQLIQENKDLRDELEDVTAEKNRAEYERENAKTRLARTKVTLEEKVNENAELYTEFDILTEEKEQLTNEKIALEGVAEQLRKENIRARRNTASVLEENNARINETIRANNENNRLKQKAAEDWASFEIVSQFLGNLAGTGIRLPEDVIEAIERHNNNMPNHNPPALRQEDDIDQQQDQHDNE